MPAQALLGFLTTQVRHPHLLAKVVHDHYSLCLCVLSAECEKLLELYERLEELDADKAEMRASRILNGLGFSAAMQKKKMKDFSGGWRMRVALAR